MDNLTGNILNGNNFLEIDEIITEAREMNERMNDELSLDRNDQVHALECNWTCKKC